MATLVDLPGGGRGVLLDPATDYVAREVLAIYAQKIEITDPAGAGEVVQLLEETAQHFSVHQSAMLNRLIEGGRT
jgi:hypothetical protein